MKPADAKPLGAYRAATPTGWAAYDKGGNCWSVTEAEAQALETARLARIEARNRGAA